MTRYLRFAFAFTLSVTAYSQQQAPPRYSQNLYLHVSAEKEAQFTEFYKSGPGKKAIQGRMKADPKITGWSVRRVAFANPTPRANFVIMTSFDGYPSEVDPAKRDEVYRSAVGMNYADYLGKARVLSEVVGTTLAHVHDVTEGYQTAENDIIVARRLKTAPGKTTDLNALEHDFRLPMMTERQKSGAIKGWAYSHLALAGGSTLPWDSTESVIYKDLASALAGRDGGAMAQFSKLFPNKSYMRYVEDGRSLSTLVRTDVYRVVTVLRR